MVCCKNIIAGRKLNTFGTYNSKLAHHDIRNQQIISVIMLFTEFTEIWLINKKQRRKNMDKSIRKSKNLRGSKLQYKMSVKLSNQMIYI